MERFQKASFVIDSIPDAVFEGYTDNETWNGWACPYFGKEEAQRVLRASEQNNYTWTFDAERNTFVVRNTEDPEEYEPQTFTATEARDEAGQQITLYGIGAFSWIWEQADRSENVS